MKNRQVYFRDSNVLECWRNIAGVWHKLPNRDAFDDLSSGDYEYFAFDAKPQNWLGDRRENAMPYIQV